MSDYQGSSPASSQGLALVDDLPNLENLAALANEIFQGLPNAAPFFAGISGLQATPAALAAVNPGARPQAGVTAAPPPVTSPALERQAAAAPTYYFAENANHYPLVNIQIDQLATQVSPQAFGLPGEKDLHQLLAD